MLYHDQFINHVGDQPDEPHPASGASVPWSWGVHPLSVGLCCEPHPLDFCGDSVVSVWLMNSLADGASWKLGTIGADSSNPPEIQGYLGGSAPMTFGTSSVVILALVWMSLASASAPGCTHVSCWGGEADFVWSSMWWAITVYTGKKSFVLFFTPL